MSHIFKLTFTDYSTRYNTDNAWLETIVQSESAPNHDESNRLGISWDLRFWGYNDNMLRNRQLLILMFMIHIKWTIFFWLVLLFLTYSSQWVPVPTTFAPITNNWLLPQDTSLFVRYFPWMLGPLKGLKFTNKVIWTTAVCISLNPS